jgi:hypothetical protein
MHSVGVVKQSMHGSSDLPFNPESFPGSFLSPSYKPGRSLDRLEALPLHLSQVPKTLECLDYDTYEGNAAIQATNL